MSGFFLDPVLVIFNFSAKRQTILLTCSSLTGNAYSVFGHAKVQLSAKPRTMGHGVMRFMCIDGRSR